jgi:four helix bundle protein
MGRFQGDLPDRSYRFALAILSLVDQLPQGTTGWVLGKQLVRSGTGIGANVREASSAATDREFAHICNIARREAGETHYWLSLCIDHGLLNGQHADDALREADELHRILSTIVKRTHHHLSAARSELNV